MAFRSPCASVWARFDPLEEPFEALSASAASRTGRVTCFHSALGESEGELEMYHHVEHSASSSILAATDGADQLLPEGMRKSRLTVPTTLDTGLGAELEGLDGEVLLNLDVQG